MHRGKDSSHDHSRSFPTLAVAMATAIVRSFWRPPPLHHFLHSSSKLDCRMFQKCQNLGKVQRNIIDLSKYFCVISGFPADRKCRQNADTPPPLPDAPDPGHVLAQPRSIPSGAERNQRKKMASNAEIVFSTFIPPTSPPPPTEARIPKSLSLIANVRTKRRKQRAPIPCETSCSVVRETQFRSAIWHSYKPTSRENEARKLERRWTSESVT